jgi:hypothetical protein
LKYGIGEHPEEDFSSRHRQEYERSGRGAGRSVEEEDVDREDGDGGGKTTSKSTINTRHVVCTDLPQLMPTLM